MIHSVGYEGSVSCIGIKRMLLARLKSIFCFITKGTPWVYRSCRIISYSNVRIGLHRYPAARWTLLLPKYEPVDWNLAFSLPQTG